MSLLRAGVDMVPVRRQLGSNCYNQNRSIFRLNFKLNIKYQVSVEPNTPAFQRQRANVWKSAMRISTRNYRPYHAYIRVKCLCTASSDHTQTKRGLIPSIIWKLFLVYFKLARTEGVFYTIIENPYDVVNRLPRYTCNGMSGYVGGVWVTQ